MKFWIWILPALLLAACSSNRSQETENRNLYEHDNMKSSLQQYRASDSLKFEQLQRDIVLHRQALNKSTTDIDVLNRQLENLLSGPQMKVNASDIDSLKSSIKDLQVKLLEQSDLLKFTSDRITTVLEDAMDNSKRVVNLEKDVASIKQSIGSVDGPREANKNNSAYQTIASLESALASTQMTVKELQKSIAEISIQLQTLISDPNVKPNPNVKNEAFQNQFIEFRTQLSELRDYMKKLENQVSGSLSQRDRSTAEQPLVKIEKPKLEVQTKQQAPAPVPANSDSAARLLYDKARNVYENRNLDKAQTQFRDFLKLYPEHELASNSQYWLGETYFAAEEYQESITEMQKVIDRYPSSSKAPDAQYKIGMSYLRLGDKAKAKVELEKISQLYPDYERMNLVDKQLNTLK